jgi:hypothetical protein
MPTSSAVGTGLAHDISPEQATDGQRVTITVAPGSIDHAAPRDLAQYAVDGIQVLAWPLVVLALAFLFRQSIRSFAGKFLGRLKTVSLAGVSIDLAAAEARSIFATGGAVDIRRSGTENNVNDSTLASFYEQIRTTMPIEYVVVDLGSGKDWLSSRLFILAVILTRMRGLQAMVFVESKNGTLGHFIGVCQSTAVRWRLAKAYPRYEAALSAGEFRVWRGISPPDAQILTNASIANDDGAFVSPEDAANLLRGFLAAVQSPIQPDPQVYVDRTEWQMLTRTAPPAAGESATYFENAEWLTGSRIDALFDGALDVVSFQYDRFQLADAATRNRVVLTHAAPWLAVVRDDGRFLGLITRQRLLEDLTTAMRDQE